MHTLLPIIRHSKFWSSPLSFYLYGFQPQNAIFCLLFQFFHLSICNNSVTEFSAMSMKVYFLINSSLYPPNFANTSSIFFESCFDCQCVNVALNDSMRSILIISRINMSH